MNYEEMSDFEINSLVAKKYLGLFVDVSKSKGKLDSDAWLIDSEGLLRWTNYNPCQDPKHAWPIIAKNYISIELDEDCLAEAYVLKSYASDEMDRIFCLNENPLRAAMICFLKMKDAEASQ